MDSPSNQKLNNIVNACKNTAIKLAYWHECSISKNHGKEKTSVPDTNSRNLSSDEGIKTTIQVVKNKHMFKLIYESVMLDCTLSYNEVYSIKAPRPTSCLYINTTTSTQSGVNTLITKDD